MRRRYDYDDYDWYPPSRPLEVKGGIKSQSKRVGSAANWWAKRWTGTIESFGMGARLTRGRSYARKGQVLSIDVQAGKVDAKVQGSRPTPYNVKIGVKPLSAGEWNRVIDVLSNQALFAAQLLAGEMPQDIEKAFEDAGVSLFPRTISDLDTSCSCPDSANPCKHIAAVYYLLGEEFDRDPFLLFKLRGMTREDLVAALGTVERQSDAAEPPREAQPLAAVPGDFWNGAPLPPDPYGEVRIPPVSAALPSRLGSPPFWRGETPFLNAIDPAYAAASPRGLQVFEGESLTSPPAPSSGGAPMTP